MVWDQNPRHSDQKYDIHPFKLALQWLASVSLAYQHCYNSFQMIKDWNWLDYISLIWINYPTTSKRTTHPFLNSCISAETTSLLNQKRMYWAPNDTSLDLTPKLPVVREKSVNWMEHMFDIFVNYAYHCHSFLAWYIPGELLSTLPG